MNKTKQKHTSEPWWTQQPKAEKHRIAMWIKAHAPIDNGRYIAKVYGGVDKAPNHELAVANAKRIVECVNACEHAENPQEYIRGLESKVIEYDRLMPMMLEALKKAKETIYAMRNGDPEFIPNQEVEIMCIKAIAKAEGGV